MSEPWFNETLFGALYGSIAGSVGGTLGGLLGALAGVLAPRGKGRAFVLGAMWLFVGLGVAQVGFGVTALVLGQPWGIWFFPVLCGGIFTVVVGGLIPVVRQRYAEAEERRIQAEGLRTS